MPLTVTAPEGAHFEFEEVKTKKGTESLGDVPILVWDDCDKMVEHYGAAGVTAMADGTSFRVAFQSIARRYKQAETPKSDDEIAKAQIEYRPGTRNSAVAKPENKAARAAKAAAEKTGNADAITALLEAISSGKISAADVAALSGVGQ